MPSARFDTARKLAHLSAELLRYRSAHAPGIAAKAILARSLWGIDVTRFLMLGMHDQRMQQWPDCMGYLSDLEPGLHVINWHGDGKRLTVDKLITAERLAGSDIPAAPLIAVVGRDSKRHPHADMFPVITDEAALATVLEMCPDRIFVKPATGWRGTDVCGPERRDGRWWIDGTGFSDVELAQRLLTTAPPAGFLIQPRLRSHQALAPIGGQLGLGTVRINTALTTEGPQIFFVFAKIMGSECLVDNFSGGKFGNMLARVNAGSGQIERVYGRKRDQRYLMEEVSVHPVTGTSMPGFQLPLWSQAIALAKRVAAAFPEAPLIGSDVALTDAGPVIIEVQSDWDANAPQLVMAQGLRPILRDLVPRLALAPELKERAMQQMGLTGRVRGRRRRVREARA